MTSLSLTAILVTFAVGLSGCGQAETSVAAPPGQANVVATRGATRGLDPTLIEQAMTEAAALERVQSIVIACDGQILAERRLRGPPLDTPVNIKSASKTVLSAVAGAAVLHGVLDGVDQPVAPILAADLPPSPDPRLNRITVGDLMSMQAGLGPTSGANYGAWVASPNWVRYALARPFVDAPGGRMIYSTGSSHLLSAVLTRASGRDTHALAQDWLAQPLGIRILAWSRDPQGIYFGGNDMMMSPHDLIRFGELYRNDGMMDGERILPPDWVAASWRPRTRSPWSGYGYGYGWFFKRTQDHDVHFAWGYGGQMLFVVPDLRLTVVMISDPTPRPRAESHIPALQALLDERIIPAAIAGDGRG